MNTAWARKALNIITIALLLMSSHLYAAVITVDTTDSTIDSSGGLGNTVNNYSFDAGATADLLVVAFSSEKSGGTPAFSYNGVPMIPAVVENLSGIWYLHNPFTGGPANVTVDFTGIGTVNGYGLGIAALSVPDDYSIALNAIGSITDGSQPASLTVNLTSTRPDAFIMTSINANKDERDCDKMRTATLAKSTKELMRIERRASSSE